MHGRTTSEVLGKAALLHSECMNNKCTALIMRQVSLRLIELAEYENPKNWTRSYNYKGELLNKHALYLPKLEK